MQRRSTTGGKPRNAARPKTAAPKRRNAAKALPAASSPAAGEETEVARLKRELNEALERQAATADVLQVISRSSFDLQAVLDTLVEAAGRLSHADRVGLRLLRDGFYHHAASYGFNVEQRNYMNKNPHPAKPGRGSVVGRVLMEGKVVHIEDAKADPEFTATNVRYGFADIGTALGVPLSRGGELTGLLVLSRRVAEPFTARQIELVTAFAAQAVIAIENTRLLNELRQRTDDLTESLEQQTATSEVLQVISSSPGELEPVFQAMLANAKRLCQAQYGGLFLSTGDGLRNVATHGGTSPIFELLKRAPVTVFSEHPQVPVVRAAQTRQIVHVTDVFADPGYVERDPIMVRLVESAGARTVLAVPMLKEDELVGAIAVYRQEAQPFTDKQIALVQNFAAQAVIAIENTRLLNELRQSLQQQTATADVLKVISRSTFDLQVVLDTLTESASILCAADIGAITREDGSGFRHVTNYKFPPDWIEFNKTVHMQPGRGSIVGRSLMAGKVVQVPDVLNDPEYTYHALALKAGYRTFLAAPMIREGKPVGVLTRGARLSLPSVIGRSNSSPPLPTKPQSQSRTCVCSTTSRSARPS